MGETALALSTEWLSSLPYRYDLTPTNFGWTTAQAVRYGLTASWFPVTGFIILSLGTLGLFLLMITRLLLRR
jgi:hypothetical protein